MVNAVASLYFCCEYCRLCSFKSLKRCADPIVLSIHIDDGMPVVFAYPTDILIKVSENAPPEVIPFAEPLIIELRGLQQIQLKEK